MKQSLYFIPTTKEIPNDAEAISHQLLIRGGFIRQEIGGVFMYLPLAYRSLQRIEKIIEEEMDKISCPEMLMPVILPASLWQKSGRYENYGPELFKLQDRAKRDLILGPTHEESFADLIRGIWNSYKDFPKTLYQIQTKFRDELRPRFGLLRNKEFIMLDGYSFGATDSDLDYSYDQFDSAFRKIFDRTGLNYISVVADNGAMGGRESTEFQAVAAIGEDDVAYVGENGVGANIEVAVGIPPFQIEEQKEDRKEMEKVATPDVKTVSDVANFFKVPAYKIVKSIVYFSDDQPVLVVAPGDHEINENKLQNGLSAKSIRLATPEEVKDILGVSIGSVGPVDVKGKIKIVMDLTVNYLHNFYVGANTDGFHYQNVNCDRDFVADEQFDLIQINEGDLDPKSNQPYKIEQSIEIGHIFKLGTFYSEGLGATFLDQDGNEKPIIMGSYGIGVSRLLSAIVEQNNDQNGIIWPKTVTPFDVHIIEINNKDDEIVKLSEKLEKELESAGYSVLLDDRKARPGVKFAESDLIGFPLRVVVGKKAQDGIVEIKERRTGQVEELKVSEVVDFVRDYYSK
ncbi:proline--tRNA ligase [Xylocopilactobacillus apis]|uniref:Proline--tRNA ligase n=1 Tax=Xylocopilactobacillus apis TaxID=2932183 RepID=A0AAU9D6C4_9LACO|nr:proline--tRNA ligase [Xylocopilactobacillus apis]BDR56312.1 proline--tRNA ligase [Xylocopilactobacillus apis]